MHSRTRARHARAQRSRWRGALSQLAPPTLVVGVCLLLPAEAQQTARLSPDQRALARGMLSDVANDVRKNYYDVNLRGLNWDAMVSQTRAEIDQAPDLATANAEIEALLEQLHDSHTFFVPPRNDNIVDYGWSFQAIGTRSFVTTVEPKSDADRQGVKPGDEVLTINGFNVDRDSASRLNYAINLLMPRTMLHVYLRDPAGKVRSLDLAATVKPPKHTPLPHDEIMWKAELYYEKSREHMNADIADLGPQLMVIRVPAFLQTGGEVDSLFRKARGHATLILDLRGNHGGLEDSVTRYLSDVLSNEVKVADILSREKPHGLTVKPNHHDLYEGKLVVLIDSVSASAAEIFARTVQLQGRGEVMGDISAGSTMLATRHIFAEGTSFIHPYFDSVTIGDLRMPDGSSLEGRGVRPDTVLLPTAADLANGRDPVLARAAASAGVTLTPEAAAKLFPQNDQP